MCQHHSCQAGRGTIALVNLCDIAESRAVCCTIVDQGRLNLSKRTLELLLPRLPTRSAPCCVQLVIENVHEPQLQPDWKSDSCPATWL